MVLFPGRGEHAGVYPKLGARLAFDGYRVTVPEAGLPARIAAGPGPVVLLGHDTGAVRAPDLAAKPPHRSVAAEIVQLREWLRAGTGTPSLVRE